MRVSVLQMSPGADKAANIAQATRLIDEAVGADRPDMISLPEMWTCLGGDRETKFRQAEALPARRRSNEPGGAGLRVPAPHRPRAQHRRPWRLDRRDRPASKLFNTTLVFGPDGAELARYRKIHLFDITTPGGQDYRESATYGARRPGRDLRGRRH